jgi:hypothetical protein
VETSAAGPRPPAEVGPSLRALLRQVAATGLPGRPERYLSHPLEDGHWSALLGQASGQRLQGHLLEAIGSGALPVTEGQREAAEDRHLAACANVLRLERRLLEVGDLLRTDAIEPIVLKGSAIAHLSYPEPAARLFGDLDLLVRSDQLGPAVELLERELSAVRSVPEVRPGWDRRFAKSVTLRCPDGIELDLHRHLLFGTFAFRVDLDELFASAVAFDLGGQRLRSLGPETRFLHACYHAALGDADPRLSGVRDVAQLLHRDEHDPDRVLELAAGWGSLTVVRRAVGLCREVLGVEPAGPIVEAVALHRPPRRDLRAVASYVGENRSHAAKVLASLPFMDGVGARASFLVGSALPSRRFVSGSRGGWLRKGWRSLTRRSR